jgi:PucR-like helix-turn-helix protein
MTQHNGAGPIASFAVSEASAHRLPADMETLESLVEEILAPLLNNYDGEHSSAMLESLRVYFEHDRHLGAAASELYVHKHTLGYRLGTRRGHHRPGPLAHVRPGAAVVGGARPQDRGGSAGHASQSLIPGSPAAFRAGAVRASGWY